MNNILSFKYSVAFYSMCKIPDNVDLWRVGDFPLPLGVADKGSYTWDGIPIYFGEVPLCACSLCQLTAATHFWERKVGTLA